MKHLTLFALLGFFLASCVHTNSQKNLDHSLYERIGGEKKLRLVVSDFVDQIASNPKTSRSFDDIKLEPLKDSIFNQFCQLAEGNCEYDGETMENAHYDAEISNAEFDLSVQALRDSLDNNHINTREKNELLRLLAPMKREIVRK